MKAFAPASVKAVLDGVSPHGEFEVILSAPTLDRDGEVIDARAFEPLPDHITFDVDHGLSTQTTVGSGVPRYEGDLLKVSGTFSSIPRAQEVRTLVTEGHIRTTSVAFMGAQYADVDGVPHIVKAELLNGAFVPIPSNREAAVLMAKSLITDDVQAQHDATVAIGAQCAHPTPPTPDELADAIIAVRVERQAAVQDSPDPAPEDPTAAPAAAVGVPARDLAMAFADSVTVMALDT